MYMAYPIEKKLVIAVASSALFDLTESDSVFKAQGIHNYREYQNKKIDVPFEKGVAFPFVRRLLKLNDSFPEEKPIEVVLMSRNSPETGLRAFRSIAHYGLDITRAAFSSGTSHFCYLPAFNASLFLSANEQDVKDAIKNKYAAGRVINKLGVIDDENDNELRIAFDFDGVIVDDESEIVYKSAINIEEYQQHEKLLSSVPLQMGPFAELLKRISYFQKLEITKSENDKNYKRILKIAIVTARNAPAHERVISTLRAWDVDVDQAFFLGGIEKSRVLNIMKPHIFFDDQMVHFENINNIPAVHIPFGVANE
jgi:5'-nucleotidase